MLKRIIATVIAAFLLIGAGYAAGGSNANNNNDNEAPNTPAIFTGNQAMNPDDLAAVGRCDQ